MDDEKPFIKTPGKPIKIFTEPEKFPGEAAPVKQAPIKVPGGPVKKFSGGPAKKFPDGPAKFPRGSAKFSAAPAKIPSGNFSDGPAEIADGPVKLPGGSAKGPVASANVAGESIKVGRMNRLEVVTDLDFGVYLDGKNQGEILMPRKYVPEGCGVGDSVDAFVYLDSEDRLIATTEEPYAMEGELAYLRVVSSTGIGAFLDWGLVKDLLVPFREQREQMEEGRSYIVYIYYDTTSERLVASTKVYKYIGTKSDKYHLGDEVELIICNKFDLGYRVIIDREYVGVIYSTEIFQELDEGQKIQGYVKTLRPDGKIDVELQKSGDAGRDLLAEKLLDDLRAAGGFLPLSDKSDPKEIYDQYKVSKRVFKRVVGGLYKKRLLMVDDKGLRLL